MAYIVKIDDKEFKCDIEKSGNSYVVSLNGKNIQVEVVDIDKETLTLIINNRPYQIHIGKDNKIAVDRDEYTFEVVDEKIARVLKAGADAVHKKETIITAPMPGLVIAVDRDKYTFEVVDEKIARVLKAGADAVHKKETIITAPMPGLVIEVEVSEGDAVKKGQGLVIIEAMKMQNEFKAPRDGVIKKIFVQKGQTVNSKDKLIIIE